MITRKSKREIEKMQKAADLLVLTHKEIAKMIKPGISTMEIEQFVDDFLAKHGATAEQKGYQGYKYATCASINDEICHGFPRSEPLKDGDIVTIDMVVNLNGALADSAWTYAVGDVDEKGKRLMEVTKKKHCIKVWNSSPRKSSRRYRSRHPNLCRGRRIFCCT